MKTLAALFFLSSIAFAQNSEVDYVFSCGASLYNTKYGSYTYVNNEQPNMMIDLGYGVGVELAKIDNKRVSIVITENGKSAATFIMDGTKSNLMAVSAANANVNCHANLKKN